MRRATAAILAVILSLLLAPAGSAAARERPAPAFAPQHRLGFVAGDDWEPATAADASGQVYVLYKHYDVAGQPSCRGCDRHLLVQESSDGGRSWDDPRPIAPGPTIGGQFDPQLAVDPIGGRRVWASFLQNSRSSIAVVHSDDFGRTWSAPRLVSTRPPGLDKDILAVRGDTAVVAYDDNRTTWVSVTHNNGATWSTHRVFAPDRVHRLSLAAGGAIDREGRMFFSWDSFGAGHTVTGDGPVTLWVSRSDDGGASWTRSDVAGSAAPPPCTPCGFAYLSAQAALAVGSDGVVHLLWNAGTSPGGPERVWLASSTDHGANWSAARQVSTAPAGVEHAFPALVAGRNRGDLRLGWMDTRTGRWDVYYRSSGDGGAHLSATVRLSTPTTGYPYIHRRGFALPYGDYFQLSVDGSDRTHAAFGEGPSYAGPGTIWVTRQL